MFPGLSRKRGFRGNTLKLLYLCLSFVIPTNPEARVPNPGAACSSHAGGIYFELWGNLSFLHFSYSLLDAALPQQ